MKKFFIQLKSWEFWPVWLIYIPILFVWFCYAIRLRSFFFFTTVNPNIIMGGFAGESKIDILNQIPQQFIPISIYIDSKISIDEFVTLTKNQIEFPCIVKPDVGERGLGVQKCLTEEDLIKYFKNSSFEFIIQEFISLPIELAVLYYRLPNEKKGIISSVCQKDFLSVQGNGENSVEELMYKNERAYLQIERLKKENPVLLKTILKNKEKQIIEHIGNHNKGTIFLDKNEYINDTLVEAFDELNKQIPELHFGRYDLKCNSIEDLQKLQNFKIMEINGVSAEPAHIYEPGYPFFKAQQTLLKQWNVIYQISKIQIYKGIKPMKIKCALRHINSYLKKLYLHHN